MKEAKIQNSQQFMSIFLPKSLSAIQTLSILTTQHSNQGKVVFLKSKNSVIEPFPE